MGGGGVSKPLTIQNPVVQASKLSASSNLLSKRRRRLCRQTPILPLLSKRCLCRLEQQLPARQRGRALAAAELQRAEGSGAALPPQEHQRRVNICSGTTHHPPEGLRSLLRWETPAGCQARCPLLPEDGQERLSVRRRRQGQLPPAATVPGTARSPLQHAGLGEASRLSPEKNYYYY